MGKSIFPWIMRVSERVKINIGIVLFHLKREIMFFKREIMFTIISKA